MHQNYQNLIVLLLASTSAFIVTPSHAQSLVESNNSNTNNITSISSDVSTSRDTNVLSQPSDLNKSEILSENSSSSSTSNAVNTTATTSNQRIPISSRIFAVPSMQQ